MTVGKCPGSCQRGKQPTRSSSLELGDYPTHFHTSDPVSVALGSMTDILQMPTRGQQKSFSESAGTLKQDRGRRPGGEVGRFKINFIKNRVYKKFTNF